MVFKKEHSLFLNTLLCIGLFQACIQVYAIPVNLVPRHSEGIKYPINVACECDYSLYVDGKYIEQANKEVNIIEKVEYGHPGWNATKTFNPIIYDESPKIIALYGTGNQFPGFLNGFVMDMNNGEDYTKYQEWKCKDFSRTVIKVPPSDWFTFDYDDKDWAISRSFGMNYQNNSFQIFEREREGINLQAEWLWTSDNSNSNIYCRKKNENVKTIPLEVTTIPAQTSTPSPVHVSTKVHHTTVAQTSAPTSVSKTIHTIVAQTSAPNHVSSSVSKTIHTTVAQTSAPTGVSKTIHPTVAQTSAPSPVHVSTKVHHTTVAQTSAPISVSKTIHTTVAQTSAPISVSKTIHPTTVAQTSAPIVVSSSSSSSSSKVSAPSTNYNVVISPHIKIIIQNVKYSRNRSYNHIDNLLRKLKIYHDDNDIYRQILHTRHHIRNHYNTILHDIRTLIHLLRSHNDEYRTTKQTPHFIQSMHKLDKSIKNIEHSLQFIKGNHRYILIRILQKLKLQYHTYTLRLLHKWNNNFA